MVPKGQLPDERALSTAIDAIEDAAQLLAYVAATARGRRVRLVAARAAQACRELIADLADVAIR